MIHAIRFAVTSALLICFSAGLPGGALPDGGGGGGGGGGGDSEADLLFKNADYVLATELIQNEQFAKAIPLLEKVLVEDGQDADAYNLLGFCARKLGRFEESLAHYTNALSINPDHRGVHEYIGEAYLALGQLNKAKIHLAFLDDDCWLPCDEYTDLKLAVAAYEAKNGR